MTSFTIGTIANPAWHRGFADAGLRPCLKAYRTEKMRTIAKKNIKLAAKHKYTYQIVPAVAVLDDIMEVNRSLSQRGGRAMDALYANRRQFEAILVRAELAHVVKSADGRIVACALVPNIGDLWFVDYVLGHGEHLKRGIMYLLMTGIIEEKIELTKEPGNPQWIMYDLFWAPRPAGVNSRKWSAFHPIGCDGSCRRGDPP